MTPDEKRERINANARRRRRENPARARAATRRWELKNPDKAKAIRRTSSRRWREQNPEKYRANWKRNWCRKYGITPEQRDALFQAQGRKCAMCGTPTPTGTRGWHIDHCHKTKKVRGILCHKCNLMLGFACDSTERLEAGIAYLSRHSK